MRFWLPLVLVVGAAACSGPSHDVCHPPTAQSCPLTVPSFKAEIVPILNQRCNDSCHSPMVPKGPWPLDTWQNVNDWSTLLVRDLKECTMPPAGSGVDFPDAEREKLWAWLICSAPDN